MKHDFGALWNDDRENPKYLERNLYQSHCVHHTAHVADDFANVIKIIFPCNTYFFTGCGCTYKLATKQSTVLTFTNFKTGINVT
jgi:hypothetical protein